MEQLKIKISKLPKNKITSEIIKKAEKISKNWNKEYDDNNNGNNRVNGIINQLLINKNHNLINDDKENFDSRDENTLLYETKSNALYCDNNVLEDRKSVV